MYIHRIFGKIVHEFNRTFGLLRYLLRVPWNLVILADIPIHGNLGDQAIAYAESRMLRDNDIDFLEVTANELNGREWLYAALTPKKRTILITGGGFLGSLWPNEELRVNRIVHAFKRQKIVILPQTVYYNLDSREDRSLLTKAHRAYAEHPALTLFLRERTSYDFARRYMPEVNAALAPDMVMYLEPELRNVERNGVLLCLRDDKEKTLTLNNRAWIIRELDKLSLPVRETTTVLDCYISKLKRSKVLSKKLQEFKGAELVVTDRLHGMIFAAITGTPCVVINSKSPKIQGCYEWISNLENIFFLNQIADFPMLVPKVRNYGETKSGLKEQNKRVDEGFRRIVCEVKKDL